MRTPIITATLIAALSAAGFSAGPDERPNLTNASANTPSVSVRFVERTSTSPITIRIAADGVNIRAAASTSAAIIGHANRDATMTATCKSGDFLRGRVGGRNGYVAARFTTATWEFFSRRPIDRIPTC